MARLAGTGALGEAEAGRALDRMLFAMRWVVLAAMLLITLAWPITARTGHPLWPFVLVLAAYNGLAELLRTHVRRLRSYIWVPFTDLPVAGLLYYLDAEPGGPLFISFYLAVITAGLNLSPLGTLLYTGAVTAVVAVVSPTLPLWSGTAVQLRTMSGRLVVLCVVGLGTAILSRRLARQEAIAQAEHEAAARLAELERLRSEFIASVSHDLRTPLTAAGAALGMMATSAADRLRPDERQLLANAQRNVGRLKRLIDDLLAFNQLEAGALRLDYEPLDLRAVVSTVASALQPLFHDKGQFLELDLPEPLELDGDGRRLEQVITNLLANAHHHTPTGTRVLVHGRAAPSQVHLRVSDDGPGIPPEELEGIFRRFHRLATTGGSGLGLAIARAIVDLHGGQLWAVAPPDGGAAFHVQLPRRPPSPQ